MNDSLNMFFIGTLIFTVSIFYGANYLSEVSCKNRWQNSGFISKYELTTGCLIEVSKRIRSAKKSKVHCVRFCA